MPAPPLANTFESGQPDGTSITTGNSGPAAGDAFTLVTGPPAYSMTQVAHGALSAKCDTAQANKQSFVSWNALGSLTSDVFFRTYLWFGSAPSGTGLRLMFFLTNAAAVGCQLMLNTDRTLQILNSVGSSVATSSAVLATSTWYRIEVRVKPATTNNEVEVRIYADMDSTTITDTFSHLTHTGGANLDRFDVGACEFANGPTSFVFYIEDVGLATSDWLGPALPDPTPPVNPDYTTFPKAIVRPGRAGGQPS
jgi:hypothetical protein